MSSADWNISLTVKPDEYGNLWVYDGKNPVIVWYSYGRVYTIANAEEEDPRPRQAKDIAQGFLAIASYLESQP